MLRSMTGYGHDSRSVGSLTFTVDLKSVNHRYSEVVCRLPREWSHMEDPIRRAVGARVKRGRVDVSVAVERTGRTPRRASVDWELAEAYADAAKQAAERFGLPEESRLTASELLSVPGIFEVREDALPDDAEEQLLECVSNALDQLVRMREAEGHYLTEDAAGKLSAIEVLIERMSETAPRVVADYQAKLHARIEQLLGGNAPVDPDRLAAEVAYLAERTGIDEELTRLRSHTVQFAALLRADQPTGRKLDFLLQEMNREANTIGSKANYASLSALVVEVKSELEKLREQSQNFE